MAVEHIKKWKIGDAEVVRLVEVNAWEDDITMLIEDATPEDVKAQSWMIPLFATAEGKMLISFQCFVMRCGGKNIMIDTCIGADRQREFPIFSNMPTTFLEDLTAAGYPPESIDIVLCTHLHFDHVGWNTRLVNGKWVPTFPNARYLFGRKEYEHWMHLKATNGYHHMDHLEDSIQPIFDAGLAELIEPDHFIAEGVKLFPTPGHTPGHVSVLINSGGREAVITGDMIHHPIQLVQPGREGRFDMNKEMAAKTRENFVNSYADKKTLVIGSHFCHPTSGHIVTENGARKLVVSD